MALEAYTVIEFFFLLNGNKADGDVFFHQHFNCFLSRVSCRQVYLFPLVGGQII